MRRNYEINTGVFITIFIVYAILSSVVFLYIYAGWISLGVALILFLTYLITFIVLLVSAIHKHKKSITKFNISLKSIIAIFAAQSVPIIFGGSDCGDAPGYMYFLQRVFSPHPTCNVSIGNDSMTGIFLSFVIFYSIAFLIFTIYATINKKISFAELTGKN